MGLISAAHGAGETRGAGRGDIGTRRAGVGRRDYRSVTMTEQDAADGRDAERS